MFWNLLSHTALIGTVMLIAFFVMRAAFGIHMHLHGYSYAASMAEGNNAAFIRFAGIFLGAGLGFWGVIAPTELGLLHDLVKIIQSLLLVITFMVVAGYVNDKLILPRLDNLHSIFVQKNVSVALIECGSFIATGLIFSASQQGEDSLWKSTMWFVGGQLLLIAAVYVYAFATGGVAKMNEQAFVNNTGSALSLMGFIISVGLVIRSLVINIERPEAAALALLVWVIVTAVLQFAMNRLVVRGENLSNIVASYDKNSASIGAGALQGFMFLVSALVIAVLN